MADGKSRRAAKQVLREAADTEGFFDLSDAERLIWMLERAFAIGVRTATAKPVRRDAVAAGRQGKSAAGTSGAGAKRARRKPAVTGGSHGKR